MKLIQVLLRQIVTLFYRVFLRPSDDFDKNILYKMVWDRRPILRILNEKVSSRKYVQALLPDISIAQRFYETTDLRKIDWDSLPRNFVIKASHGSGGVLLVHEGAPMGNKLPNNFRHFGWRRLEIHPENFDRELAVKIFTHLLKRTYGQGLNRGGPEWAYWHSNPHVIVEEFLSFNGKMPMSIVFNVVRGEVKLIIWAQVFYATLGTATSLPSRFIQSPLDVPAISKELRLSVSTFEEMISNSLQIAANIDFLRVDWLITDSGVFFNELTNYPGAGLLKGRSYYKIMSEMWRPHRSDYQRDINELGNQKI